MSLKRAGEAAAEAMNDLGLDASFKHKDGLFVARAVLEAIREPSDEMVEAGARVDAWVQSEGQAPQPEIWQAMIDAAIEEEIQ